MGEIPVSLAIALGLFLMIALSLKLVQERLGRSLEKTRFDEEILFIEDPGQEALQDDSLQGFAQVGWLLELSPPRATGPQRWYSRVHE